MQTAPLSTILLQSLRANRDHGFVYLNNAKVGCSTVKSSLWAGVLGCPPPAITRVHAIEGSPFDNDIHTLDWVEDAFIFTFVRNPHARLVSAYLDKIRPQTGHVWEGFARRHGHDPDRPVSFDTFVEMIAGTPPEEHDPHWRPQHINTLQPFVTPNFVGDLDRMDTLLPDLLARLFPGRRADVQSRRHHGTAARTSYRSHLTDPATIARMQRLYAGDFELFGYDPDPARDPAPMAETRLRPHRHSGLARLVRYRTAPPGTRGAALNDLARGDPDGQLSDWILAQRLQRAHNDSERVADLLARHAGAIGRGPAFLRKAAARLQAGPGAPGQALDADRA